MPTLPSLSLRQRIGGRMTIPKTQNLNLYAFEQNPADDEQTLFQIPKHWRYKGVKPSLTPLSLEVGVSFLFRKNPHFNPGAGSVQLI